MLSPLITLKSLQILLKKKKKRKSKQFNCFILFLVKHSSLAIKQNVNNGTLKYYLKVRLVIGIADSL